MMDAALRDGNFHARTVGRLRLFMRRTVAMNARMRAQIP
jgi:hypothetical protein